MPPRGRKRRGKELVAAVATDAPGDAAAAVSPEYVEAVVAELEHESERRVKKLKRQMGDMRQEFLNHHKLLNSLTIHYYLMYHQCQFLVLLYGMMSNYQLI